MYSPREMRVSMPLKPLSSGDGGGEAFSLAALAPVLGFSKPHPSCLSLFFPGKWRLAGGCDPVLSDIPDRGTRERSFGHFQLILPLRATGVGAHKATLEEDTGIRRRPKHGRSTRQEKARWGRPLPGQILSVLGVPTTWQGRWGPLRGEWGLSTPFFFLFFLPLSLSQKHTHPIFQIFPLLSHKHTDNCSVSVSLWAPPLLPPPPHLSALGSVETPALPNQRCQKWGHDFWTEDMGHAPCPPPPPAPPDGFYYLIRSSS